MLRHRQTENEDLAATSYSPVARRDVMAEAHIEDFLDHQAAPLVGRISYEERQELRAESRQQILSLVAAHEELGSSRGEAIALAIRSMEAQPGTIAQAAGLTQATRPVEGKASVKPALLAFGASSAVSLALAFGLQHSPGNWMPIFMALSMGAFPFIAGTLVGLKQARKPIQSLVLAQLLLYVPVTALFYLVVAAEGGPGPVLGIAFYTAVYSAITTLVGGAGIHAGGWLKQTASRLRGKAGSR